MLDTFRVTTWYT